MVRKEGRHFQNIHCGERGRHLAALLREEGRHISKPTKHPVAKSSPPITGPSVAGTPSCYMRCMSACQSWVSIGYKSCLMHCYSRPVMIHVYSACVPPFCSPAPFLCPTPSARSKAAARSNKSMSSLPLLAPSGAPKLGISLPSVTSSSLVRRSKRGSGPGELCERRRDSPVLSFESDRLCPLPFRS